MSASMRAAVIQEFGAPGVLTVRHMIRPAAGSGEVLVRVVCAGAQLTDAAIRSGWTPPGAQIEFPQILGNEFAGVIEEVGADAASFQVGDQVAGATVIGTASESNHDYVRSLGAVAVAYGAGQAERIRAISSQIDVAFDAAGHDNLRTAVELVNDRNRVGTVVDMALAAELGCRALRSRRNKARLADLMNRVEAEEVVVHVRRSYRLSEVADAHRDVEIGHGRGKVVLQISAAG